MRVPSGDQAGPSPGCSPDVSRRPAPDALQAFAERLYPQAPAVTVRNTQGGEIWAACGQLANLGEGAPASTRARTTP